MLLRLFHGRSYPSAQMEDWGTEGPVLRGIDSINWTYGETRLHFCSEWQGKAAAKITGWTNSRYPTDMALHITEDLVETKGVDKFYYGDFSIENEVRDFEWFLDRATIWADVQWCWNDLDPDAARMAFKSGEEPDRTVDRLANEWGLMSPTELHSPGSRLASYMNQEEFRKALRKV